MIRLKLEILIQSYLQLTCTYHCIIYSLQFRKQVADGSNSDSSYLWPAYFVERPNGIFNAPIERNHLPELIRVRRLPPKLSAADTAGMASVGIKKEGKKKYNIEIADISGKFHFAEPSKHTARKNASITSTTIPSSKALVS